MMNKMKKNRLYKTLLSLGACTLLAACQTAQDVEGQQLRSSRIDSALERAALAASPGGASQSIGYLEKIYKRNSGDVNAAMNYARALRETDYLNRAAIVLAPFANDANSPSAVKTEYAAIQLAQGNYIAAEEYAQIAILQDESDYKAYHYLGVALDAQAMHKKAERAFRKGLDHWQGDPTIIMNNLALNLASQGFLEEAIEILQKAQAVAPHRLEIERNLRIVTALQQSSGSYNAPKPVKKPAVVVEEVYEEELSEEESSEPEEEVSGEVPSKKASFNE